MAKTVEEIVQIISTETERMSDAGAREFLESVKDEIDTMLDMIPEEEEEDEEGSEPPED